MYLQTLIMFSTYVQVRGRVGPAYKHFFWARPILSRAMHKDSRGLDSQFFIYHAKKIILLYFLNNFKTGYQKDLF